MAKGGYDGTKTFGDLKKYGDFGMGTLQGLDGEMIAVDGKFYQADVKGKVREIGDAEKTPYALVTFFKSGPVSSMKDLDFAAFKDKLDSLLPDKDNVYAIKTSAVLKTLKVRSVPAQAPPYPSLDDAIKHQAVFDLENIKGTLVGFRFPSYMAGVNFPGYHFHFISDDRIHGGHVLDCLIEDADTQLQEVRELSVNFTGADSAGGRKGK